MAGKVLDETGLTELWSLIKAEDEAHDRFELLAEVAVNQSHTASGGGTGATVTTLLSASEFVALLDSKYDEIYIHFNGTIYVKRTGTVASSSGISLYLTSNKATSTVLFGHSGDTTGVTKTYDEYVTFRKSTGTAWFMPSNDSFDTSKTLGVISNYATTTFTGTLRIYGRRVVK